MMLVDANEIVVDLKMSFILLKNDIKLQTFYDKEGLKEIEF